MAAPFSAKEAEKWLQFAFINYLFRTTSLQSLLDLSAKSKSEFRQTNSVPQVFSTE
jgi:hypothetical protein